MLNDSNATMAVPTLPGASPNNPAQTAPNTIANTHDTSTPKPMIDTSPKPRIGVDFAAHQLPFRPSPMVRKRRAATESPERDVRRRVDKVGENGEFSTECFTAASAPKKNAAGHGSQVSIVNSSEPVGSKMKGRPKLAGPHPESAPKEATPPGASMLKPLGNGLPSYEETTAAGKGIKASKWAPKQNGETSDEVEMGGTDKDDIRRTSRPRRAARNSTEEVLLPKATEFTGMPALDLLHGSWTEVPAHAHMGSIIEKIITSLKKKHQASSLILQGRSVDYHRLDFDLDANGPLAFRKRLEQCFPEQAPVPQKQRKVQRTIHQALEEQLWHVVCWNLDAFPELAGKRVDNKEIFPALFPGSYTSVFDVLATGSQLDFNKHAATARVIFNSVLRYVHYKAPDSPLLRVEPLLRPAPSEIPKNPGETKRAYRSRKKLLNQRNENAPTPAESLLSLAFTTENFYTGLVRKMGGVAEDAKPKEVGGGKMEIAVEALLYRLALKEPRAFPEVFATEYDGMVDA